MGTELNTNAPTGASAKRGPGRPRKNPPPSPDSSPSPTISDPKTINPPPGVIDPDTRDAKGCIVTVDLGNGTTSAAYKNAQGQIVAIPDQDGQLHSHRHRLRTRRPSKPVFGREREARIRRIGLHLRQTRRSRNVPAVVDRTAGSGLKWKLSFCAGTGLRRVHQQISASDYTRQ